MFQFPFEDIFAVIRLIIPFWWVFTPIALFFIFKELWMDYIQGEFAKKIPWTLLEIKIPRDFVRTPKAMETALTGIYAIQSRQNIVEKYWDGKYQEAVSLEIVGIEGTSHFFIRTPTYYRNFIEAHLYAQYPQAEITEAEDYVKAVPESIPNDEWDLWGYDLVLALPDPYPIRTYISYEHKDEEMHIDPVAGLLEWYSKLQPGQQMWFQINIVPADDKWRKEGEKLVAKLAGKPPKEEKAALGWLGALLGDFWRAFAGAEAPKAEKKDAPASLMQHLSPGEVEVIKAIEMNMTKLGFKAMVRVIFVSKKEIFSKRQTIPALFAAINPYRTQHLNGLRPYIRTKATVDYFKKWREPQRKARILKAYRNRSGFTKQTILKGLEPKSFVLSVEELATIFHFPAMSVATPLASHVEAKAGEPPVGLPMG
ncbi:hypothetical protein HY442_01675 [Candidatus Parcubacteria bacterium]|nr:hypothetical protein [Candidatus Parcubacteria bacterium]